MSITLYHIALVIHVIGITVMAGASFIDFITFRALCKVCATDPIKGIVLENYLYKLQRFLGIGMLLILISGVAMMIKFHEVWGAQLWFRIKMGILLLIIINGLALRRRVGNELKNMFLKEAAAIPDKRWGGVKKKLTIIQIVQMLLLVVIYVLSVFKFN